MTEKIDKTKNILLVGVGGQGIILASKILSEGLMRTGYDVKMSEIHGMSQRGGSVSTHVRFGARVHSPIVNECGADIFVAFERVEAARWIAYLKPGGTCVVNEYMIHPLSVLAGEAVYPDDVLDKLKAEVPGMISFNAGQIAADLGNVKTQNIVMLGALVKCMKLDGIDWLSIMKELVPPKLYDLNAKAFEVGAAKL
jgi:indolepyruvate ferredoxin oxidoreductase beta subunit